MIKEFVGEKWKEVKFDFEYTNSMKIEVSNFGRVRNTTDAKGTKILEGSMQEGYKVIRLRFFKERDPETQKRIDVYREKIAMELSEIRQLKAQNKAKTAKDDSFFSVEKEIEERLISLGKLKKKYQKIVKKSDSERTINKMNLIHRWVATYFVEKPSPEHNIVSHWDYDKVNNKFTNLMWTTREQNVAHQAKSPYVIESLATRKGKNRNEKTKVYKLTTPKVMLIKKKINAGVSLRTLAKNFDVTETQLLRIKRGENWVHVQAAN